MDVTNIRSSRAEDTAYGAGTIRVGDPTSGPSDWIPIGTASRECIDNRDIAEKEQHL